MSSQSDLNASPRHLYLSCTFTIGSVLSLFDFQIRYVSEWSPKVAVVARIPVEARQGEYDGGYGK